MTPTDIVLKYSNVYARTEPMDVATPTEQIWANDQRECEWENLLEYGPPFTNTTANANANAKREFQQSSAWFYGVWKEWGWNFSSRSSVWNDSYITAKSKGLPSPRIFNPIVQRNAVVIVDDRALVDDDVYLRYVVYTGERNINDPSTLVDLAEDKEMNTIYWAISFDNQQTCYCLPICDYSSSTNPIRGKTEYDYEYTSNGSINKYPYTQVHIGPYDVKRTQVGPNGNERNGYKSWGAGVFTSNTNPIKDYYMMKVRKLTKKEDYPWPLLRNHVYRLTIRSVNGRTGNENINGMVVESERRASPTIVFN